MSRTAQVNSIDAIEQFRASLGVFADEVGQVLSALRTDLQRFQNWLEHDQLKYWQHQIRIREERVAEAKNDLHRCLSATIDPNRTPSCLQEKKLLAAAKTRLEEAERKLAAVRHWIQVVRQAVADYHARSEPLASVAAADVPRAQAELARTVERLNAYLELAVPTSEASASAASTSTPPTAAPPTAAPPTAAPTAAPPESQSSPEAAVDRDEERPQAP
jgi:hypothetical protein